MPQTRGAWVAQVPRLKSADAVVLFDLIVDNQPHDQGGMILEEARPDLRL